MNPLRIEHHLVLPSTNDRALALARDGVEGGWVIVADMQTTGRGQRGAVWHSPSGDGLYASFLLRPRLSPECMSTVTLAAGVATYDAIEALMPGIVALKWPNDLLLKTQSCRGAKVGGILVESASDSQRVHYVVIGVGLNLRGQPETDVYRARSLESCGCPPPRDELLQQLGQALTRWVSVLADAGGRQIIHRAWEMRALGLGEPMELWEAGTVFEAQSFDGLAPDGALRVRLKDGIERRFMHGRLRLAAERRWVEFPSP
ncbi:MAG: biotin--[acetyl-CoA-carboxylase] ligase [Myxococcales bacterium]|nr:biotin--[acetyl-CoA-carboxylase] ligase [Myxococcales bacterium]